MTDPRCGSVAGYSAHWERDEPTCQPCRDAQAAWQYDYANERLLTGEPRIIDASGTTRRLRALIALGWPLAELTTRLGWKKPYVSALMYRDRVKRVTADKVAALYDDLSMTPGPSLYSHRYAERQGWPPPLAWDDDTIDDPAARPAHDIQSHDRGKPRDLDLEDRVLVLTRAGLSAAEIAVRLRTNKRQVVRIRARYRSEGDAA